MITQRVRNRTLISNSCKAGAGNMIYMQIIIIFHERKTNMNSERERERKFERKLFLMKMVTSDVCTLITNGHAAKNNFIIPFLLLLIILNQQQFAEKRNFTHHLIGLIWELKRKTNSSQRRTTRIMHTNTFWNVFHEINNLTPRQRAQRKET